MNRVYFDNNATTQPEPRVVQKVLSRARLCATAIGLSKEEAQGTLRISLGKYNTGEEVDYFLKALGQALEKIKRGD